MSTFEVPNVARAPAGSPLSMRAAAGAPLPAHAPARAIVLGASGYSGQEFMRLAAAHPALACAILASREHAGESLASVLPGFDARDAGLALFATLEQALGAAAAGECDVLVSCLPHGVFAGLIERAAAFAPRVRVIDLSADHRRGEREFRYGLPEADRDSLALARRVANPGCYPTAATLALLPALEGAWLGDPVMVSALSGVSGAGRAAALRTSFVEMEGGASIYRAGDEHPHAAEIARNLLKLSGEARAVGFTPQLVPMARGIL
ncbi:MAG: hypothetical protein ACRENS_06435, partial [Candidatus Eiseniibacteriota bacterium]